jgi:hypothetical protein
LNGLNTAKVIRDTNSKPRNSEIYIEIVVLAKVKSTILDFTCARTIIAPLASTVAVKLTFFIIMEQTGLVTKYLLVMKTGSVTISRALGFVQELIPLKTISSPEKLKKIKTILESSRVALTLLGHADGPILKFVSIFC